MVPAPEVQKSAVLLDCGGADIAPQVHIPSPNGVRAEDTPAGALAKSHLVEDGSGSNQLLKILATNEARLRLYHKESIASAPLVRATPAGEWLLDNFYLIEEQIQATRRHLPRHYGTELPHLTRGTSRGQPRVFDIAREILSQQDGQVDGESLGSYMGDYQGVKPLKLGELWAMPIMMRLAVIEMLGRVAKRLRRAREDRSVADRWIERLEKMSIRDSSKVVIVVAEMASQGVPLSHAFAAQFCQRLARKSAALQIAKDWFEHKLGSMGHTLEQFVGHESREQAANQITVSNCIATLRYLGTNNWRTFVESVSLVEHVLKEDPAGTYSQMDFATRDLYRHSVEMVARYSGLGEEDVARQSVTLARTALREPDAVPRKSHVGYYLIDQGQSDLEREIKVRWPWSIRLRRALRKAPLVTYLGAMGWVAAVPALSVYLSMSSLGIAGWELVLLTVILFGASLQMAQQLVNWLLMQIVEPQVLPRMDLELHHPDGCDTLVVVPSMLTSLDGVDRLVERLEIHYLANRDRFLRYGLLTDFVDAATEETGTDDSLTQRVRLGIESLQRRYAPGGPPLFFLFHRPRLYSVGEGAWIGYERKRGKLAALNAYLRGGSREDFSLVVGDILSVPAIRYVITLDADTQLPKDAARQLVGTMEHPLNRPVIDPVKRVVIRGYGILQPRVIPSLPTARLSWFARLYAGDSGIDPYTRAVSDVYQDLFGEGTYIGKGIYDVDAFETTLRGRFADGRILSHDLIESCFSRSGLVSDVELVEVFPIRHDVDAQRRHRWIRGDWQILEWCLPQIRGRQGLRIPNPLSALSRWKVVDNLRRSLVPPLMVIFLLMSWIILPVSGLPAAGLVLLLLLIPVVTSSTWRLARGRNEMTLFHHGRRVARSLVVGTIQALIALSLLVSEAILSLDAICRTLVRRYGTHRNLLEWRTSSDSAGAPRSDLAQFNLRMWCSPVLAAITALYLFWSDSSVLIVAGPVLIAWLLGPTLAWWISLPRVSRSRRLSAVEDRFLHVLARRTWGYFDRYVTQQDNWLPPDNFQVEPVGVVAHRTSPTNIGMALLANLSARDFGYLSTGGLLRRTRDTLTTIQNLEKHRGHLLNWYDTESLDPLTPRYVSTVDSGNLAGMLIVLAAGLREVSTGPEVGPWIQVGLRDTLAVLEQVQDDSPELVKIRQALSGIVESRLEVIAVLRQVGQLAHALHEVAARAGNLQAAAWSMNLHDQCKDHLDDLELHAEVGDHPTVQRTGRESLVDMAASHPQSGDPVGSRATERLREAEELARLCESLAEMEWDFLYDPARKLFSIGFSVSECRLDSGFYDLLASESRLGSYVAIAQGAVSQDHWFSLGRLLVASRRKPIMVSWSGSMFEYLMPQLVMPLHEDTLLEQTCVSVVYRQIEYGELRGVPWGVSESGYNRTDAHLNYQYRAFGVPGIGLKRGLAEDLVIAPYASVMALMIAPVAACANLLRLKALGCMGEFGFFEAVDYTPSRIPPGQSAAVVRSYMAHHQGMSLLALGYLLCDRPMQRRFLASPMLSAVELLLHERIPQIKPGVFSPEMEYKDGSVWPLEDGVGAGSVPIANSAAPEIHLLSNGRYHVAVSAAGGGFSRWDGLDVTRWREDATCDSWGFFIYLRDLDSAKTWSVTLQPTLRQTSWQEVTFGQGRAVFRHIQAGLLVQTEISVSPEDDVEIRRVTITNRSTLDRRIELTSYAEVVLATAASDAAHPTFSNLFVQTESDPEGDALYCTRRARTPEEVPPHLFHLIVSHGGTAGETTWETDRSQFLGRLGSPNQPAALSDPESALTGTTGSVLDPMVSLRRTVLLEPGQSATVVYVLGMAWEGEAVRGLVAKYRNLRMTDRAFELAWTHSQVSMRQLDITESEVQIYRRLASGLVYANSSFRAHPGILRRNRLGQSVLWAYGISGDVPIVFLAIADIAHLDIVMQLAKAHSYWRMKGLTVDLVIVNDDVSEYRQTLHDAIVNVIALSSGGQLLDKPGGIFVRRHEQIADENLALLQSVARIVLEAGQGSLDEMMEVWSTRFPIIPNPAVFGTAPVDYPRSSMPPRDLIYHNGMGGFTRDGREYIITLTPGKSTPLPWVNVIANPFLGTVVSESGGAYTWIENAREFRLTPWNNDPVRDANGEALYIRDDETGKVWSPSPLPTRGQTGYVIRHGFGYSVFEHTEHGIASELWVYVAMDAPVKFMVLKLRDVSGRPRRLTAAAYFEWVLGDTRSHGLMHIRTEADGDTGALLARNCYNTDFPNRVAFVDVDQPLATWTGDRSEFIGRNGTLAHPAGMRRKYLSGRLGAGLDPCGAVMVPLDLRAGSSAEIVVRLGVGRSAVDVSDLLRRFRQQGAAQSALKEVHEYWNRTLGSLTVQTPDPAINVFVNGWLLYQTLSCRLWARSGFYQSGGAYGFRDQLQDSMALVHAEPELTRAHLLRAASRQYLEGDVQHWWHPPMGRGVRTHFSDDFLWLPYAVHHYVTTTGDAGVLDSCIPFLDGRAVKPGEDAYYDNPTRTEQSASSLYDHCVRAINRGMALGDHGLPLIGSGDWNDGMNMVGREGRGESVWLAFFLYTVLQQFAQLADGRQDGDFANRCRTHAALLQRNIEANAWDGEWYLRAFFDNGTPLGTSSGLECRIDSLPQSWAVISGAGDPDRARQGMKAVEELLVDQDARLIRLFTPAFDKSELEPGYIKGYIPGVRENGGQYTHGAVWVIMATALMGNHERAWELLALIHPIHHNKTPQGVAVYKAEPYVVAADVYGVHPHMGRGGWTWYTGAAGWMYRLIVETLLGITRRGTQLHFHPRLPTAWPGVQIQYRYHGTVYHISMRRIDESALTQAKLRLDGAWLDSGFLELVDDGHDHHMELDL